MDTKLSILLVDDEKDLLRLLSEYASNLGHQVTVSSDPRQALKHIRENPDDYDLVIADVMMPYYNGITFTEEIRKVYYSGVTALISSYVDSFENEVKNLQVDLLLRKPFSLKEFDQLLKDATQLLSPPIIEEA